MKRIKVFFVLLVFVLSISMAIGTSDKYVVSKRMVKSSLPEILAQFGLGDRLLDIDYSDGSTEYALERTGINPLSIASYSQTISICDGCGALLPMYIRGTGVDGLSSHIHRIEVYDDVSKKFVVSYDYTVGSMETKYVKVNIGNVFGAGDHHYLVKEFVKVLDYTVYPYTNYNWAGGDDAYVTVKVQGTNKGIMYFHVNHRPAQATVSSIGTVDIYSDPYEFELFEGTYTYEVRKEGYQTKSGSFIVKAGQKADTYVSIEPAPTQPTPTPIYTSAPTPDTTPTPTPSPTPTPTVTTQTQQPAPTPTPNYTQNPADVLIDQGNKMDNWVIKLIEWILNILGLGGS